MARHNVFWAIPGPNPVREVRTGHVMSHGPYDNVPSMLVAVQHATYSTRVRARAPLHLYYKTHMYTDKVGDVETCSCYPRRQVISGLSSLIGALNQSPMGVQSTFWSFRYTIKQLA